MFKALVAVACLAVIGFVGVAGWDRYQASQRAQQRAEFESFCDLNYRVEANVIRDGEPMPAHIREGTSRCRAAGMLEGR